MSETGLQTWSTMALRPGKSSPAAAMARREPSELS